MSVRSRTIGGAACAFGLASAAALIKLPAAVYLLPVLCFSLVTKGSGVLRRVLHIALALVAALLALGWYHYARHLELLNGIANFGVEPKSGPTVVRVEDAEVLGSKLHPVSF